MKTGLIVFSVILVSFCGLCFSLAGELEYPSRPVQIWVGFAAGGGADLGARMVAENSKNYLGQDVAVINKPGGAGRVVMPLIAKAKPDGYTLGAVTDEVIVWSPHLEEAQYKLEDFTYICQYGTQTVGVVVREDSPFRTFKDLVDFARVHPNELTVSTVGVGSTIDVPFGLISLLENLKIKLVPYSGSAPAATALLGGHVMATAPGTAGFAPHVKAKTLRLLATLGDKRTDYFPEVPTLKELGYPIVFGAWYVIFGPKNMEKSIVKKLGEAFRKAMESPSFIKLADENLKYYEKNALFGDELKEAIVQRSARNEEYFKRLGLLKK